MNSKQRFLRTVNRQPVDRPAAWLGMPDRDSLPGLFVEYGVQTLTELKLAIGDDFFAVEVPYHSETSDAIYAAFDWYQSGALDSHERTLTREGCFAQAEDVEDIAFFSWPDPAKYIDPEACKAVMRAVPEDKVALGILWSAHFQDTCASFGMENAMMNMIVNPELFAAVDEKIVSFYLKANEIFYEATRGRLDAVLIGNDLGSQRGLMVSPEAIRSLVLPGARRLVEQAHAYGLKVIYHSCGSIDAIIPDLIDIGVDSIHPMQANAAGMEPQSLKDRFGSHVSFCGGVDTQDLLVNGTADDVARRVKELRQIFPTGLIISPSHEAILPDVPPKNIRALFQAATALE